MKNFQIQNVQKEIPDFQQLKQAAEGSEEWRVPITLSVSSQPLYLKVVLAEGFPMIAPQFQVLSRVSHMSI